MKFTSDISLKIRTAIKVKLAELGNDVYEELPDYIMVMVANRRSEEQMAEDLSLFLGDNTQQFTSWLHSLLSKLQSVASVSSEEKRASGSAEGKSQVRTAETPGSDHTHSDSVSEHSNDEDAASAMPCSNGASKDTQNSKVASQKTDCSSVDQKSDGASVDLKSDSKSDTSSVDRKSDSSFVDHADSTSRDRSVNDSSITCDTDNLETEKSKTDSGTPENQEVSWKRKKHSVTRVFRVKSRKLESESDSVKSNIVSSSKTATEQGTDASDSEKETKSYTQIRKMKQSNGNEVSSSVPKTEVMENERVAEVKENRSEDNYDQEVDNDLNEEMKEGKSQLKQL